MASKLLKFIRDDIWRIRACKLSRRKCFFIRTLRVFLLSLREFDDDQCQLRASALTFYALLSIVPVMALIFGIAQGFGFADKLEEWLLVQLLDGQKEIFSKIIIFAYSALENTKGNIVAGVGVVILFWSVVKMLGNIEKSFDHIWGVKSERTLLRKFTDYLSLMLIGPVVVIVVSSVNVFVTSHLTLQSGYIWFHPIFDPIIFAILSMAPYAMLWALLTFLYIYMPNTKVKLTSAFIGGLIAGTLYQAVQWFYIHFQIQVSQLNAIYGSFAALPFFLIWLQLSWLIILYGAEIAFAHQNEEHYEFESDSEQASLAFKKLLALEIVQLCVQRFSKGEKPQTAIQIAQQLDSPIRLIREVIDHLVKAGILNETKGADEKESALQPAQAIDRLTITYINRALEQVGVDSLPLTETPEIKKLKDRLHRLDEIAEQSPENVPLQKIA